MSAIRNSRSLVDSKWKSPSRILKLVSAGAGGCRSGGRGDRRTGTPPGAVLDVRDRAHARVGEHEPGVEAPDERRPATGELVDDGPMDAVLKHYTKDNSAS